MEDSSKFPAYHFMREKERRESGEDRAASKEQGTSSRGPGEKGQRRRRQERELGGSSGEEVSSLESSRKEERTSSGSNNDHNNKNNRGGVTVGVSGVPAKTTRVSFDAGIPHGVGKYTGEVNKDSLPDGQVGGVLGEPAGQTRQTSGPQANHVLVCSCLYW